jgi:hypothetical protein
LADIAYGKAGFYAAFGKMKVVFEDIGVVDKDVDLFVGRYE